MRPILTRTLYLCEMADRPPTFALERIRDLLMELAKEAVVNGIWDARLLED